MNSKWKHARKPKRAFFIPIFIQLLQFETYGRWLTSRAMKNQKELQRAMKSNEKQEKAMKSNKKQKRTSELEKPKQAIKKPKRAAKGTKGPNGNQAKTVAWLS